MWSTNPVFSTGSDISCLHSSVPHGGNTNNLQISYLQAATELSSGICWNMSENVDFVTDEVMQTGQLIPRSHTRVCEPGRKETSVDDSMDLDVFTIDTPRFERRVASSPSNELGSSESAFGNMEEIGVQTEHTHGSVGLGFDSHGDLAYTPSPSDLHELTELKQSIEVREQELMDSFALLSEKLAPYPSIMSKSLDEIRTLQTMVEEKDLQITRLYSQVYKVGMTTSSLISLSADISSQYTNWQVFGESVHCSSIFQRNKSKQPILHAFVAQNFIVSVVKLGDLVSG